MFASSIDTVQSDGTIKKTVLLCTSKYSNVITAPAKVDLRIVNLPLSQKLFKRQDIPVAMLFEGEFVSNFKFRPAFDSLKVDFKEKSIPTKMIVIGDGDIAFNSVNPKEGTAFPCGLDIWTEQMYNNRTFLLNAMNYLCGDAGLLSVRSREFVMRVLDAKKVDDEKTKWQLVNTAGPIGIVVLFGMIAAWIRKKKYGS